MPLQLSSFHSQIHRSVFCLLKTELIFRVSYIKRYGKEHRLQLKWTNLQYEERGHCDVQVGELDVVADAALHSR